MNLSAIDRIETNPDSNASLELSQFGSRASALFLLGLALPASLALIAPFALIGLNPVSLGLLSERPGSALLLGCGLIAAAVLLVYCVRAGVARLSGRRIVSIRGDRIMVEQHGLLGVERWTQPMSTYVGVAHHIRASLSGTRHEIVLVHQRPEHDVLLGVSQRAPAVSAAQIGSQLGLPEVEAKMIYLRHRPIVIGADIDGSLRAA